MRKTKFLVMLLSLTLTLILLSSISSVVMAQPTQQPVKVANISYNLTLSLSDSITMTAESQPPLIQEGDKDGPKLNGADPTYVPSEAELKFLAEKEVKAQQHMQLLLSATGGNLAPLGSHFLDVGASGRWQEPNDYPHRNYCGPGATQVALDARLPASQVPNIDTIGADEHIDPSNGVTTQAIRDELNRLLNVTYYAVSSAANQSALEAQITGDIDDGYSMITALKTGGMPGWGTRNVKHIVATYGYGTAGSMWVNYVETAAPYAGFNGSYFNNTTTSKFWAYVRVNNSQVW